MEFELYEKQKSEWPKGGKHILANYNDNSIIVYQAYNREIAKSAIKHKNFHNEDCIKNGYNFNRMSWIKTNFLWMMYRSGWATKPSQENILAIRISKAGFDEILANSVVSSNHTDSSNEWKQKIKTANVVMQWDPDHLPNGEKEPTGRRAIQLGLRGDILKKFSETFILDIIDLTEFVNEQRLAKDTNLEKLLIPKEKIYLPNDSNITNQINLTLA